MSKPLALSISTNVSSERIALGLSAAISVLIASFTALADTASPPSDDWIAEVKKYLSSNSPRAQLRYLFEVTRLTVDSCISITSATWRSVIGLRCATPWRKKASCCFTISLATLMIVRWRWSSALTSQLALASMSLSHALLVLSCGPVLISA